MERTRLGAFIRNRRQQLGLTQEMVEELSGVSQHYQSQIERGKVDRPGDAFLEALAQALELDMADIRRAQGWVVEGDEDAAEVRFAGIMPADSVRWCETQEREESVRVWTGFLGSHAPKNCFVVTASGDCLLARGINDGRQVLLRELAAGEWPRDGAIVAVRIDDEFSLKVWSRSGDEITLSDGDGRVVFRGAAENTENLVVLGVYLNSWDPIEGMR